VVILLTVLIEPPLRSFVIGAFTVDEMPQNDASTREFIMLLNNALEA
jgi:hypothetical protein